MPMFEVSFHFFTDPRTMYTRIIKASSEGAAKGAIKTFFADKIDSTKGTVLIMDGAREIFWHAVPGTESEILE